LCGADHATWYKYKRNTREVLDTRIGYSQAEVQKRKEEIEKIKAIA
jgi:hypothetical protein